MVPLYGSETNVIVLEHALGAIAGADKNPGDHL